MTADGPEQAWDFYIKILTVGACKVGKSSALKTYETNTFPAEGVPGVSVKEGVPGLLPVGCMYVNVDGVTVKVNTWDSWGENVDERMRMLSFPATDVYIAMYAINNVASFEFLQTNLVPEVQAYMPQGRIVVAGSKADLRESDPGSVEVSREEGEAFAKRIGAYGFYEFSALTQTGLQELFSNVIRVGIGQGTVLGKREPKPCVVQ